MRGIARERVGDGADGPRSRVDDDAGAAGARRDRPRAERHAAVGDRRAVLDHQHATAAQVGTRCERDR